MNLVERQVERRRREEVDPPWVFTWRWGIALVVVCVLALPVALTFIALMVGDIHW